MNLLFTFPNKENRNRFLCLVAQNVGTWGYGLGLEFEGLEYVLGSATGSGRIRRTIPTAGKSGAYGGWSMEQRQVSLDLTMISAVDDRIESLVETLNTVAHQFGA